MKTAEEILKPYMVNVETFNGNYLMVSKVEALSAMQEYAKQEAIAFHTWLHKNYIMALGNSDKWYDGVKNKQSYTTAELYEEYLKSKQH